MPDVLLKPYAPPTGAVFATTNPFSAPLQTQYDITASNILDKNFWRVTSAFKCYLGLLNDKYKDMWVYVPAGYLTDGATVPRVFWDLLPPWGAYGQAAVIHDILCEYLTIFHDDGTPVSITREHADTVLGEAMAILNVPRVTRWMITNGARLFTFVDKILQRNQGPTAIDTKRQLEEAWVPRDDVAAETHDTTTKANGQ